MLSGREPARGPRRRHVWHQLDAPAEHLAVEKDFLGRLGQRHFHERDVAARENQPPVVVGEVDKRLEPADARCPEEA
jgi:hypothetical protein